MPLERYYTFQTYTNACTKDTNTKTSVADLPVGEGVLDVVAGGVDEDAALIPGPGLDTDILMDRAQVLQLAVADRDH